MEQLGGVVADGLLVLRAAEGGHLEGAVAGNEVPDLAALIQDADEFDDLGQDHEEEEEAEDADGGEGEEAVLDAARQG